MADIKITASKVAAQGTSVSLAGIVGIIAEYYGKNIGIDAPDGIIAIATTAILSAVYRGLSNWLKHRS